MQAMTTQPMLHTRQRYLVVGLGLTGYSVACYLLRHGYDCRVQDDRPQPPYLERLRQRFPFADVRLAPLTDEMFADIDCLVVSPGLSVRVPVIDRAIQAGRQVIGDIELFAEAVTAPVVAITGSNGKSTVTSLVGEMLRAAGINAAVGGNIGVPALDLLEQQADVYVLELSSFQLETTNSLKPLAATVLNVSEDHMDRYDDLEDYRRSKQRIYRQARHCISNLDDELTRCGDADTTFSIYNPGADYSLVDGPRTMLAVDGEGWIATDQLKLKGRHNWANCLAAMALARSAGTSREAIVSALESFTGLPHRSQWVARINGVDWINDSKATNPGAVRAAVDGIDEPVILLAGGQGKGADMQILCASLRAHVRVMLLFGADANVMARSLAGCTEIERVEDLDSAVKRAHELARPGDVVLLSPACASFDQFSGFAERGERFAQYVRSLR